MKKLILAATVALSLINSAKAECYSEGIRVGVIQKFSSKGLISKSWEGEMVQGGIRSKQKGTITNVWKFSVLKPEVAKKVNDAIFDGGEVTVKYCQSFIKNPLVQNSSYEVVDIKVNK